MDKKILAIFIVVLVMIATVLCIAGYHTDNNKVEEVEEVGEDESLIVDAPSSDEDEDEIVEFQYKYPTASATKSGTDSNGLSFVVHASGSN